MTDCGHGDAETRGRGDGEMGRLGVRNAKWKMENVVLLRAPTYCLFTPAFLLLSTRRQSPLHRYRRRLPDRV